MTHVGKIMKCDNELVRLLKSTEQKRHWLCEYIKDNETVWRPISSLRELTPQEKIKLL